MFRFGWRGNRWALVWVLAAGTSCRGQAVAAGGDGDIGSITGSATTNGAGPEGIVPAVVGFNASLGTSSQHDSSNGWSSVLTPDVAYRFNRYFSVDVAIPIYAYINVDANVGTKAKPIYSQVTKKGVLGDVPASGHFDLHRDFFDYNATLVIGLPSGNTSYGLGAGQVTYDFNNHFEKDLNFFTPDVEIGLADSSGLINARVRKDYTTVGRVAHLQIGGSVSLPRGMNFEVDAYEQLPLSAGMVYSTTGKGRKKVTTAATTGASEDNGLISTLDIPLNGHVTLSGFYNRSLRNHDDTGGFSLTFLLKPPPREPER